MMPKADTGPPSPSEDTPDIKAGKLVASFAETGGLGVMAWNQHVCMIRQYEEGKLANEMARKQRVALRDAARFPRRLLCLYLRLWIPPTRDCNLIDSPIVPHSTYCELQTSATEANDVLVTKNNPKWVRPFYTSVSSVSQSGVSHQSKRRGHLYLYRDLQLGQEQSGHSFQRVGAREARRCFALAPLRRTPFDTLGRAAWIFRCRRHGRQD